MPASKKARHFGHIRKLPSGRYQASYLDSSGERVNAPRTFTKKGDAQDWLATIEADQVRGILRKPKGTTSTLAEYSYVWLDLDHRGKPLKANSWNHYDEILRHHILPTLGHLNLGVIDKDTVRKWHTKLSKDNGQAVVANAYRLLRAILNTAFKDELIPTNPCQIEGAAVVERKKRDALTNEQMLAVIEKTAERYQAMFLVAGFGGLRYGEVCGLRTKDVDFEKGCVSFDTQLQRIKQKDGSYRWERISVKSKSAVRTVHLPPFVVERLRQHVAKYGQPHGTALVFTTSLGNPVRREMAREALIRAKDKAGITGPVFPHLLRHSHLTAFAQLGATTAELLARGGHSSMEVAMTYQHAAAQRDRELSSRLEVVPKAA